MLILPRGGGSKLRLFLLYGQRFPEYGPNFIIAVFGHDTWQVAKVPEVAYTICCLSTPGLIFTLWAAVSEI